MQYPDALVWREFNAKHINEVINHPVVRPDVADLGEGTLDISSVVANNSNVLLMGEFGGCLCFCVQAGLYEVHTQVLPEGRGKWALDFVRAGMHWMFTHTDAVEITTRVPRSHRAAKVLTGAAGMTFEFERADGVRFRGEDVPVDVYSIRIQDWAKVAADVLMERGQWLHWRMAQEAKRLGIIATAHEDDDNHNIYAGVTYEMAAAGQIRKAVIWYNRWAFAARHPLIALVSELPPVIRMDIGLMTIRNGDIEVIHEN